MGLRIEIALVCLFLSGTWHLSARPAVSALDRVEAVHDVQGQITQRVWKNAAGQTNRVQILSWDSKGQLRGIEQRDSDNNGSNWAATYDPLGRRIRTTATVVTNGVASKSN